MGTDELYDSFSQRFCESAQGRDSPLQEELWGEAAQQQKEGWLREPILISDNGSALRDKGEVLNLAFRFAAPQGDKNRACDDLRHSLTNRATAVLTPIRLVSWGHVAEISNRFRRDGARSEFSKCDHKSAYKALPVDPQETWFAVITLKCPSDGKYYAFISRTQLFGSIASVIHYNVFARIIAELFTVIFGIPFVSFFDDLDHIMRCLHIALEYCFVVSFVWGLRIPFSRRVTLLVSVSFPLVQLVFPCESI